ncbi:MAG: prolipoprotein diacylglyceryl transferase [Nanoarchaeota archaeon]|nr:prolipoprotein diacylglyceryl transferase [Nanoarchaeota archaeon]
MWIHNLDPVLAHLGPLEIRWYGLVYVLGFFLAIFWLKYMQKKGYLSLSQDEIWDFVFYLMLGVLIGSRLFEIFWEPQLYLSHPLNLFKIWQGGMSFHGGLVGIVTAAWLYCKKKKLSFGKMADLMSVPAIFALALGRIANFVNGELVGRIWAGKWCVVFPDYGPECRHPNMIYSFFERMLVFGWLFLLTFWKEFQPGQVTGVLFRRNAPNANEVGDLPLTPFREGFIFWNFVFWEGLGRIMVDFFREDILYFGFSLGQWFSAVMVVAAVIAFAKYYQEDWKKIFKK